MVKNLGALTLSLLSICFLADAEYNPSERISVNSSGFESNGSSFSPSITLTADGRYVVFSSDATNLISGDNNDSSDIFLRDRTNGTTTRVSVDSTGGDSNGSSTSPSISADGNYIVFESSATDLVSGDTNSAMDVFLYDVAAGTTVMMSKDASGSPSDAASSSPVISSDGSFAAFSSLATDLVTGFTNSFTDIYIYDRAAGTVSLVTKDATGGVSNGNSSNPSISGTGRYTVFQSDATDLVATDSNGHTDIFLFDSSVDTMTLVSHDQTGGSANGDSTSPVISDDGRYIAFVSTATDLSTSDSDTDADIYLYDTQTDTITLISKSSTGTKANASCGSPAISDDGRFIAYESSATNLVSGDSNDATDIFVYDRVNGTTARASKGTTGTQLNGNSLTPSVNQDGHYIAFVSDASNIVTGDSNDDFDVFVVNQQCILSPPGVVPEDQDADGTDDCSDDCPTDPAKTAEGACGCGVADTDSDGDGTPDCTDLCDSDPLKTSPGDCGCGNSDADTSGSGQADCLDVTQNTVPEQPKVRIRARWRSKDKKRRIVRVRIIGQEGLPDNTIFKVNLSRNGRVLATKQRNRRSVSFRIRSLLARGFRIRRWYNASYSVSVPGTSPQAFSKESPAQTFRLRKRNL